MAAKEPSSKFEFGKEISEQAGWDFSNVKRGQIAGSQLVPPRPSYLGLDVKLAEKTLNMPMPNLKNTISDLLNDLKKRSKEPNHVSRRS